METLVVGAGAMGRWIGRLFATDLDADIAFLDTDPAAAEAAAETVGGRALDESTDQDDDASSERFDVVCIAVPMPAASDAIAEHGERASQAILDVTGAMAGPVAAMAPFEDRERASFHPLFAPENEPGNVPVVIEAGGANVDAVVNALEDRGNRVFETTPDVHDEAMETVQARTHAAILAFALAAEPVPDRFHTPVSGALVDLARRVTGGDSRVYADIQAMFGGAADVAGAARRLADADEDRFDALYTAAESYAHETADEGHPADDGHAEKEQLDTDQPGDGP